MKYGPGRIGEKLLEMNLEVRKRIYEDSFGSYSCSYASCKNDKFLFGEVSTKCGHFRLFGKKDKRSTAVTSNGECSQSCDLIQGKSRKSPSTTNDSGHGSQGHLEDKMEAMAIVEDDDEEAPERMSRGKLRRMRTGSCPDLSQMRSLSSPRRAPLVDSESDEERQYQMSDRMERNSSPITAADILLERRLIRKQMEAEQRHKYAAANCAIPTPILTEMDEVQSEGRRMVESMLKIDEDACSRVSLASRMSKRSCQTEDLADFDDNVSSIILDHYLPLSRSSNINCDEDTLSSEFSVSLAAETTTDIEEPGPSESGTGTSVQTDLSLLNVEEKVAAYLEKLNDGKPISEEVCKTRKPTNFR
ncbi:hypothetical protein WR25_03403 [Diploscapter pachys]|uniref:Uncharacterized protein n=1 Tax=Diploscapter pachys TaxID=2018661 RepID=A0A2A2LTF7_9BILA|nr:hypothetical protein WR25_03403 [Diploscapter pachys]